MNKLKFAVNTIHWANIAGVGAQLLQVVPQKPWVLFAQAVLAAFLPSAHGIGHKMTFGTEQK